MPVVAIRLGTSGDRLRLLVGDMVLKAPNPLLAVPWRDCGSVLVKSFLESPPSDAGGDEGGSDRLVRARDEYAEDALAAEVCRGTCHASGKLLQDVSSTDRTLDACLLISTCAT